MSESLGCQRFSETEWLAWGAGQAEDDLAERIVAHLDEGCWSCHLVAADAGQFSASLADPLSAPVRSEFDATRFGLHQRLRSETRTAKTASRRLLPWAGLAAAALLVLALTWVARTPDQPFAVQLASGERWVVEPLIFDDPVTLRDQAPGRDVWIQAGEAYRAGDYDEAATLFERAAELAPNEVDPRIYGGVSRLMNGDPAGALQQLERARDLAQRENLPVATIRWFEALSLLALDREPDARLALEEAETSLTFGDQAKTLLGALD